MSWIVLVHNASSVTMEISTLAAEKARRRKRIVLSFLTGKTIKDDERQPDKVLYASLRISQENDYDVAMNSIVAHSAIVRSVRETEDCGPQMNVELCVDHSHIHAFRALQAYIHWSSLMNMYIERRVNRIFSRRREDLKTNLNVVMSKDPFKLYLWSLFSYVEVTAFSYLASVLPEHSKTIWSCARGHHGCKMKKLIC